MSKGKSSGRKGKAAAPAIDPASSADVEKATVDMNFKVSPRMRARVKMQAGARRMTTKAMIEASLELYWATFPVNVKVE